jgi:hypothetical protein
VRDTTNYFMAWNAGIDSRHNAPLIPNLVEVRVADTAEKDFEPNVVFARFPPSDYGWSKR